MFSRKPNLHEVECPHCHATQNESIAAISTNCRACGRYFKLGARTEARGSTPRAPKDMREVVCIKCGAMNLVPTAALSTQCTRCSHYLELGNKVVKGVYTGKIHAYDDVLFAEGCSFKGMEATGRHIEVRGKVFSKLRAIEEIAAMPGSSISGELYAPVVRIERGSDVKVKVLQCDRLLVSVGVRLKAAVRSSDSVIRIGGVDVVLTARRRPFHDIADFSRLGLDPAGADIVAVKSGYLSPALAPLANPALMALSPGVVDQDVARLPRHRKAVPTFPFDREFAWTPRVFKSARSR